MTNECCVWCRESLADNFCNLPNCKCHKGDQPTENWESRFYEEFKNNWIYSEQWSEGDSERIKSFISSLIETTRKEALSDAYDMGFGAGVSRGKGLDV